jgi:phage-related protein
MAYTIEYFNLSVQMGLDSWPAGLRARYRALALRMLEYGPDLGMPHTRSLGGGLYEIRAKAAEGIGRAIYCTLVGQRIVILHGFVKKTDKTPVRELALARNRMKQVSSHD